MVIDFNKMLEIKATTQQHTIRPLVTVDIVIFTVKNAQLQVLLTKRPNTAHEPFINR